MVTSSYDPCLLITTEKEKEIFGVIGIQTDNTLFLGSEEFTIHEENELQKANFSAKPRNKLSLTSDLIFNRCVLMQALDNIMTLLQKDQGKKLQLINAKDTNS
jgi:biopolymer transport protein ExbD